MSPYRIAPAAPTPPPKRSAVVRLWHVGMRKPSLTFALCIASVLCLAFVIAIPAARSMGYLGAPVGLASSCLAVLLRGYLRLRRVRAMLRTCSLGGDVAIHRGTCQLCEDVGEPTRYPAITEARERLPPPRANAEQAKPREQAQATVTTTTRTHYRIRVRTIVR